MRTRRRATIEDLRLAIDCLPRRTRIAMLDGLAGNDIIVGAYTSEDGVCPMLAAHRNGGRTSLIAFAQAWDRLAFRGQRKARARRASERELLILRSHLEASLLADDAPTGELSAARHEHEQLLARRAAAAESPSTPEPLHTAGPPRAAEPARTAPRRAGDADRRRELSRRHGWAWTRIVRRYDDYERLLARLQDEHAAAGDAAAERAETPVAV